LHIFFFYQSNFQGVQLTNVLTVKSLYPSVTQTLLKPTIRASPCSTVIFVINRTLILPSPRSFCNTY